MIRELIKKIRFSGGNYKCIVCGRNVRTFFRFSDSLANESEVNGFPYSFRRMETLNFDQCNCPFCLSTDRDRLYLLYLEKYIFRNLDSKGAFRLLDFAPNADFSKYLKRKNIEYLSADISRSGVDMKLDICDMHTLPNDRFDFVVCSHILEHVSSPESALRELHRILKPGGSAIVMVPIFWDVTETKEDPSHSTAAERWRNYGQDDHVRLFEKQDFLDRIKNAGFVVSEHSVRDFEPSDIALNAISANSALYVAHKA